jgi:hypothetical protein
MFVRGPYILLDDDILTSVRCPTVLFLFRIGYNVLTALEVRRGGRDHAVLVWTTVTLKLERRFQMTELELFPELRTTTANHLHGIVLIESLTLQFVTNCLWFIAFSQEPAVGFSSQSNKRRTLTSGFFKATVEYSHLYINFLRNIPTNFLKTFSATHTAILPSLISSPCQYLMKSASYETHHCVVFINFAFRSG